MEVPASGPRPRSLGRSSMFCFFRSLVGSKRSPKSSDKAPRKGLRGQDAVPLMTNCRGRAAWKESRPPTRLTCTHPEALPRPSPSGLEMGDPGPQTSPAAEVLRVVARSVEVKPVLPRGSQEVLGHLSELEEREEVATGEASGNTGTSER